MGFRGLDLRLVEPIADCRPEIDYWEGMQGIIVGNTNPRRDNRCARRNGAKTLGAEPKSSEQEALLGFRTRPSLSGPETSEIEGDHARYIPVLLPLGNGALPVINGYCVGKIGLQFSGALSICRGWIRASRPSLFIQTWSFLCGPL